MAHKLDIKKVAEKKLKQQARVEAIAEAKADAGKKTTVSALAARVELIEKIIGI
jgi:hypothetical protein